MASLQSLYGQFGLEDSDNKNVLRFRFGQVNPYQGVQLDSRPVDDDSCHWIAGTTCYEGLNDRSSGDGAQKWWPWMNAFYQSRLNEVDDTARKHFCCDISYVDGLGGLNEFMKTRFGNYSSEDLQKAIGCTSLDKCSFDWLHNINRQYVMKYCPCDPWPLCTLSGLTCCTDEAGRPSGSCTSVTSDLWRGLYFAKLGYDQLDGLEGDVVQLSDLFDMEYPEQGGMYFYQVNDGPVDPWGLFIPSDMNCPDYHILTYQHCKPVAMKTGWDDTFKEACCLDVYHTLSDKMCDPRWFPEDDWSECGDVIENLCTFATSSCGKHVFLSSEDEINAVDPKLMACKTWYSRIQSYDPYAPNNGLNPFIAKSYGRLHTMIQKFCSDPKTRGNGECSCFNWHSTCTGANCIPGVSEKDGTMKYVNLYCSNGPNTERALNALNSITNIALNSNTSAYRDILQSACTNEDSVTKPTVNPINGLGLFPTHCWLPDCQASTQVDTFFDPIMFTVPCPDICAIVSSGLNVDVKEIDAGFISIANMVASCTFGQNTQLKAQPFVVLDPCSNEPATELQYILRTNDMYLGSFSVFNMAVDPKTPENSNLTMTVFSGDLFPFVRVHPMPDNGASSVTVGIAGQSSQWIYFTINAQEVYGFNGSFAGLVYVTDSTGANAPTLFNLYINVEPGDFDVPPSCKIIDSLVCCGNTEDLHQLRANLRDLRLRRSKTSSMRLRSDDDRTTSSGCSSSSSCNALMRKPSTKFWIVSLVLIAVLLTVICFV
jgi:hypothetical protein